MLRLNDPKNPNNNGFIHNPIFGVLGYPFLTATAFSAKLLMMTAKRKIVYTIGHSNHSIERFIELLKDDGIECLMDVRRFPTSKRYPQFNRASVSTRLLQESIDYQWLGNRLGGFRSGGYEIYMSSEEYQTGIALLKDRFRGTRESFCRVK